MYIDVIDLKAFYASRLGQIASRLIGVRLRRQWPALSGEHVLGLGYATPFLGQFPDADRRIAFMPAAQGVVSWPTDGPNTAALVRDDTLPLDGGSVDRVLAVHCLEHAENAPEVLREIWRVLAPGGRLIIVVPNRAGLWARAERTPFGHGQPYSRFQLAGLLRDTMFSPISWSRALAALPIRNPLFLRNGAHWERVGGWLWPGFSGVLIVEATKLMHQRVEARPRQARTRNVLSPALAPTSGVGLRTHGLSPPEPVLRRD